MSASTPFYHLVDILRGSGYSLWLLCDVCTGYCFPKGWKYVVLDVRLSFALLQYCDPDEASNTFDYIITKAKAHESAHKNF